MPHKSRKDTLAICGRSGIETLKSKLVKDGYFRGLWVLPEYYEPPQPIKYRPKPEVPPYNPQPLIDVFPQTVNLGQISETPPYCLIYLGNFGLRIGINLPSIEVICSAGIVTHTRGFNLTGIEVLIDTKLYTITSEYGIDYYGLDGYGGTSSVSAEFIVAFNGIFGIDVFSETDDFVTISGYGGSGYGLGPYGGLYNMMMPLDGISITSSNGSFNFITGPEYGGNRYGIGVYGG